LQKLDDFISSKLNPDIKVSAAPTENDYISSTHKEDIQRDCTDVEETLSVQHSVDKEISQKYQPKEMKEMSIEGNSITLNT
jgi:hypothetical protein